MKITKYLSLSRIDDTLEFYKSSKKMIYQQIDFQNTL